MTSNQNINGLESLEIFNSSLPTIFEPTTKDGSNPDDELFFSFKGKINSESYNEKYTSQYSKEEFNLDKKPLDQDKKFFFNKEQIILDKIILPKPEDCKKIKSPGKSLKKKRGRKKRNRSPIIVNKENKENKEKIKHDKFSDDNLQRKCKHLVLKNVQDFINNQIEYIYNGEIGKGLRVKKLKTNNQSQKSDSSACFNKLFLNKTLCDIFSEDISTRFTDYPKDHNKTLIIRLMNEKDENKRIYFNKLFRLRFIQCLNHFGGIDFISQLNGLKLFSQIKDEIIKKYPKDGEEYYYCLGNYLNHFEEIINSKKTKIFFNYKEVRND